MFDRQIKYTGKFDLYISISLFQNPCIFFFSKGIWEPQIEASAFGLQFLSCADFVLVCPRCSLRIPRFLHPPRFITMTGSKTP